MGFGDLVSETPGSIPSSAAYLLCALGKYLNLSEPTTSLMNQT